jgi:hypothetical protein
VSIQLHSWDGEYCGSATHNAKLTEEVIPAIRRKYKAGATTRELAAEYGVDHTAIWYAVTKRPLLKKDGSVIWRFHTWNHVTEVAT